MDVEMSPVPVAAPSDASVSSGASSDITFSASDDDASSLSGASLSLSLSDDDDNDPAHAKATKAAKATGMRGPKASFRRTPNKGTAAAALSPGSVGSLNDSVRALDLTFERNRDSRREAAATAAAAAAELSKYYEYDYSDDDDGENMNNNGDGSFDGVGGVGGVGSSDEVLEFSPTTHRPTKRSLKAIVALFDGAMTIPNMTLPRCVWCVCVCVCVRVFLCDVCADVPTAAVAVCTTALRTAAVCGTNTLFSLSPFSYPGHN